MAAPNTLYLLRHAKSSWDDPDLADHLRPLAPRGIRNAAGLAEHLRRERISPDLVLCSSAQRARETLAGILPAFETETEIRIEDALYGAGADRLIARLHEVPEGTRSVMVIGHNPGLEGLAARLDRNESGAPMPTAALATFELAGGWKTLRAGKAALIGRYTPRG